MLTFFRKIRRRFFTSDRFSKYILYALGEIILVVIGILIALQINNWNELNTQQERFLKILKEIRSDLESDIKTASYVMKRGDEVDSLSGLILNYRFTKEDYFKKENKTLSWVGLQFHPFEYRKTGFNKFENFEANIPEKYDSIAQDINFYYNELTGLHDDIYQSFRQQIKDRHDYLSMNYNWYHLFRKDSITEEVADFFASNPLYKNWVAQHKSDNTAGKHGTIRWLHDGALSLILKVNALIDDGYSFDKMNFQSELGLPLEPKDADLQGIYVDEKGEKVSITMKNNYLLLDQVRLLKKFSKDTFGIRIIDWVLVPKRDSLGRVVTLKSIHLKDSTQSQEFRKLFE